MKLKSSPNCLIVLQKLEICTNYKFDTISRKVAHIVTLVHCHCFLNNCFVATIAVPRRSGNKAVAAAMRTRGRREELGAKEKQKVE